MNIDGTVASYRFPYLLAGDSLVFKQDSPYYEHFYSKLQPYKHYVPFKRNLSDLIEKIQWAREHEKKVREIINNAREFVEANLLPQHIYCYHLALFKVRFRHTCKHALNPVNSSTGMEQSSSGPSCSHARHGKIATILYLFLQRASD